MPLALDERAAVLERLQEADRLAERLLRARQIAALPDDDPERVERAAERERGPALGEERARLLEGSSASSSRPSSSRLPADARSAQPRVVGLPLSRGELDRARERLLSPLGLEPRVVHVVELEQHAALQVAPPDPLGDREPLGREPLDLVEVALPPGHCAEHLERVEAPDVVGRVDDVERPASRARGAQSLSPSR